MSKPTIPAAHRATLPARSPHVPVPTFPAAIVTKEFPGLREGAQRYMIESNLADLLKFVRKAARWHYLCETDTVTNVRSQMPSKNAKYHAYDAAYRLASVCGWDAASAQRCHSLADLVNLCDAASAALVTFDGPVMVNA